MALLGAATGCLNRQTGVRLVYAPAPPPAPASSASPAQVMIIGGPPPPKPVQTVPAPASAEPALPESAPAQPRATTQDRPAESAPVPEATTNAPPLEPLQSRQQQTALAKQVDSLKSGIEYRIGRLNRAGLSSADRQALEDARAFLSQADEAMKKGDLQESLDLAQKADLLVAAVEKRQ